jgi:hypothetical protein
MRRGDTLLAIPGRRPGEVIMDSNLGKLQRICEILFQAPKHRSRSYRCDYVRKFTHDS